MRNPDELVKLSETNLTVANPDGDIRGRDVVDRDGHKIGTVEDLFIDPTERAVRFLDVGSGGFLGIGEQHVLIPVDDIRGIDQDTVAINQTREFVAGGPAYDPELVRKQDDWTNLYSYYGYSPYWNPGYIAPPFLFWPSRDAGAGPEQTPTGR